MQDVEKKAKAKI